MTDESPAAPPQIFAPWRRNPWLLGVLTAVFMPAHLAAHDPILLKPKPVERREMRVQVPDFRLQDQNGAPLSFGGLRNKFVIINFMYTSCPDICPLLTASLKQLQDRLNPKEQEQVHFLSITTDPEIDTPAILRGYAVRHGVNLSSWSFLTGQPNELAAVWRGFGVTVRKQAKGLIDHTTLTAIVDTEGRMRFAYFGSFPNPDRMARDLRTLELSHE